MSRYLVPMAGLGVVLVTALILIFVMTLRPWGSADNSWNTHLNFSERVPSDYSRTEVAWLDAQPTLPAGWARTTDGANGRDGLDGALSPSDIVEASASDGRDGYSIYLARGCVSCHGLDSRGGAVGPDLSEATASKLRREVRKGPEGMPEYDEAEVSDEEIKAIYRFLQHLRGPVE